MTDKTERIQRVNPPGAEEIAKAYKFSQAVVAGGRVDVSGQVGITSDMQISEDITEQARQAFVNLKTVLETAGSSLENVTQMTMYYTDIAEAQAVDEVFSEFFPEQYPARTAVQVVSLIAPQLKLEIQASAILND